MTTQKQLNDFTKELTELCHNHGLYIEGKNITIELKDRTVVSTDMFYDMECQSYTASPIEKECKCNNCGCKKGE